MLFVDMVGFTRLSSRLDLEDLRTLQTDYFAEVVKVIHRWHGVVEKYIGDAVMAVFGIADSDGYDAYRAVRAGTQLAEAVRQVHSPDGQPIRVRVGIATGEALVDLGAVSDGGQHFLTGDVVNTAARLQAYSAVGTVTVTASTQRTTGGFVRYERLDPVMVAGKPEPLEIWRPLSVVGPTGGGGARLARAVSGVPPVGLGNGVGWRVGRCLPGRSRDGGIVELARQRAWFAVWHRPTRLGPVPVAVRAVDDRSRIPHRVDTPLGPVYVTGTPADRTLSIHQPVRHTHWQPRPPPRHVYPMT